MTESKFTIHERRMIRWCDSCNKEQEFKTIITKSYNPQAEKETDQILDRWFFKAGWRKNKKEIFCPKCSR